MKYKSKDEQTAETINNETLTAAEKPIIMHAFKYGVLIILIFAISLTFAFLFKNNQNLSKRIHSLHKKIDSLAKITQEQSLMQQDLNAKRESGHNSFEAKLSSFENQLNQITHIERAQESNWHILNARYFLELAKTSNEWSSDPEKVTTLLQKADAILASIPDQDLSAIRSQLHLEIEASKTLSTSDLNFCFSEIFALNALIDELQKQSNHYRHHAPPQISNLPPLNGWDWKKTLKQSLKDLSSFISINRYDLNGQRHLSATETGIILSELRLSLEEASWALIKKNSMIYEMSLKEALRLTQNLNLKNQSLVADLQEKITALSQMDFPKSEKILDHQALTQLNEWIKLKIYSPIPIEQAT